MRSRVLFLALFAGTMLFTLAAAQAATLTEDPSGFSGTGSLATARYSHTATLLPNGKVLVAGGTGANTLLASAELYDPVTGSWTATGSATAFFTTATLLQNGKVLVVGGGSGSAQLYDPTTGSWSATGSLTPPRLKHTVTLLPSGKVLVAGGFDTSGTDIAVAQLYNPATGTWSITGSLATARNSHTATLLPSGKVLVAGGGIDAPGGGVLDSAELYDPATGRWSITGSLTTPRGGHTATLLPSGEVLIAGGDDINFLASAELYDPATESWSTTGSLAAAREYDTATLLPNGKVLVAGGFGYGPTGFLANAELYDPGTGNWSAAGDLATARSLHTATVLPNGNVLVAGGFRNGALASAELYDSPSSGASAKLQNISTRMRVLTGDNVLIGGFIITGTDPKRVIIRGIGPSLPISGSLADPTVELHDANGTIATNDNWKINDQTGQSQEAEVRATGIPPTNDLESALLQTLAPGAYTAIVRGKNNTTGVGLVEVYNLQ
jgi:WD40 repeat protein